MTLSRRVDALVGHQLSLWEAAGRPAQVQPCIAIASLPGAGGDDVGRLVATRLGYGLFGREIVDQIAQRRGVSEALMRDLDDRMRNLIERYVADLLRSRPFNETDFLREVISAVTTLGRRGLAVIVGRGAAFILDPQSALRVLVAAPVAVRLERVAKQRGLERAPAEAMLRDEDARRTEFVRHHFGARLDDPLCYDLVLNTGMLGLEAAANLVVEAYQTRFPRGERRS
jgi:cytidylate kinase